MKKVKVLLGCTLALGAMAGMLNLGAIRQEFAKSIGSLSVIDARKILIKSVKQEFPEFDSFELLSQGYVKDSDFQSYQLVIEADGNKDNVIIPTYSIVKDSNEKKRVKIDVGQKRLERKIPLIRRFGEEYTNLLKEDLQFVMEPFMRLDTDIIVESPYFQINYEKEIPQELENGMDFDARIDLDWEVSLVFHVNRFSQESKYIKRIYDELHMRGYDFHKYNFTFVIDEDGYEKIELTKEEIEESLLQSIAANKICGNEYTFQMKYQEVAE